jgi:hypothetical protein
MKRRLSASVGALLAFMAVAVLPASASAVELYSGATKVPVGTQITGAGTLVATNAGFSVECHTAQLGGELIKNGSIVKILVNSSSFTDWGAGCKSTYGSLNVTLNTPQCLSAVFSTEMMLGSPGECTATGSEVGPKLTMSGASGTCVYRRGGVLRHQVYGQEPLKIHILDEAGLMTLESGSWWCPTSVNAKPDYELKTAAGGTLRLK